MPVALLLCALVAAPPAEVENPFLDLDPLVGVTAAVVGPHPAAFEIWAGPPLLFPGLVGRVEEVQGDLARFAFDGGSGWVARCHLAPADEVHAALTAAIEREPVAADLVARGLIRRALGRKREAVADLDRAVRLDPADAAARFWRGQTRQAAGDEAGAEADYSAALRLRPGNQIAGFAYCARGRVRLNRGELAGAIMDLEEADRLVPTGWVPPFDRGRAWLAADEPARAAVEFSEAIGRHSTGAELFHFRGLAREREGRFAEAVADYEQAILLDGGWPSGGGKTAAVDRLRAAWLLAAGPDASARDGARAVRLAEAAVSHAPRDLRAHATLAAAHAEAGNFEEAVRRQREVVALAGELDRGEQAARLKEYEAGRPHRDPAIGYRPTRRAVVRLPLEAPIPGAGFRPGARVVVVADAIAVPDGKGGTKTIGRGLSVSVGRAEGDSVVVKTKHGEATVRRADVVRASAAIAALDALIAGDPSAANFEARAHAHRGREDEDAALVDLAEAIRIEPTAVRYALRAAIRFGRGDIAGVVADTEEALKLDRSYPNAYQLRGCGRLFSGDVKGAAADFDEAIRLNPEYGGAFGTRATVRFAEGRDDDALADLAEEIRLDPEAVSPRMNRGALRLILLSAVEDVVDARGDSPEAARVRALLRDAEADFGEAVRLARSSQEEAKARGGLAAVATKTGRFAEALAECEAAVRVAPQTVEARRALAFQLAASPAASLRDGRRAIEEAARACRLSGWRQVEDVRALAAAYAECGDAEAAAAWQRRAAALGGEGRRVELEGWAERYAAGERYRMKVALPRSPVEARRG